MTASAFPEPMEPGLARWTGQRLVPIRQRGETTHAQTVVRALQSHAFCCRVGRDSAALDRSIQRARAYHLQPEFLRRPRASAARLERRCESCELCGDHRPPGARLGHLARPYWTPAANSRAELPQRPRLPGNVAVVLRRQDN